MCASLLVGMRSTLLQGERQGARVIILGHCPVGGPWGTPGVRGGSQRDLEIVDKQLLFIAV